jgi:ADP-heptose:LPS heptosyltransferase
MLQARTVRILFITSTRIGDAVLSTGLLDHLLRAHPGAEVTVACGPAAEGLFARMPNRARTIVMTKRGLARHWFALWRATVGTRWDLVVDLRGSAVAWTVRARRRAIKKGGRRPGHRLLHIAETLGLTPAPRPVAWFGAEDAARVAAWLPAGPFLALGPTANVRMKVWPPERFVQLAQALTGPDGPLPGAPVVVLGGPGPVEAEMAAPLLAALPCAVDLVGRLSLPEAAAVLARAALYVGNDSGLMHLAAATGAPTLGLFGPTQAAEYAPVGPRAQAVLAAGPPGGSPMTRLALGPVVAAARRALAREPAPAG